MKTAITKIMMITVVLGIMTSCNTAEKQLLSGEFEQAFDRAVDKLGNPNRKNKDEFIRLAEDAFAYAQEEDLETVRLLEAEGRPDRWLAIMDIYNEMKYRQDLLRPHLPLFIKDEHRYAKFELLDVITPLAEAKHGASDFLYTEAEYLLGSSRKQDARDAYNVLCKLENIAGTYKNSRVLREDAKYLGTERVTVEVRNRTGHAVPNHIMRELNTAEISRLNDFWIEYLNCEPSGCPPDYRVLVKLECVDVTPEQRNEIHYTESKVIFPGGTAGDSTSVKGAKKRTIYANVIETKQRKTAKITGRIEYSSANGKRLLKSIPVFAEVEFLNISASATGNMDALSAETRAKLKGGILPFPTDHQMFSDAQMQFETAMLSAMQANKSIIGI